MKKKTLFPLVVATALLLLSGCQQDDPGTGLAGQDPRTPLVVNAGVNTRAENALWHANDAIGLYTLVSGTASVYDGQANYQYLNTAGEGATATFEAANAENTAYFPDDDSEVDVVAYYPYSAANSQLSTLNFQLSDQSSLPAIDLMTSALAPGHSAGDANVELVFRHRLAKLAMVIKTDESTAAIDPSTATVTLHGTATKGTYNLLEQKITAVTDVADIRLASRTAIVMPTEAGAGVTFTVTAGGKDFTATLPEATALPAGKVTTVTITLKIENSEPVPAGIEATITDWEGGPTAEVDAIRFTMPTHPETGVPSITEFTVMKNGANPTFYDYRNNAWTATPAFFLVEDTQPTDEFTATATQGREDAISGLTDLLEAGPATMDDKGVIALEFSHTLAQLNIQLSAGDGFTDSEFLSTANVVYKNPEKDLSYTGANRTFIINPTNFKKGDVIAIVTVNNHAYEAVAEADITLAKGTKNKLNITLSVETQGKRNAAMSVTTKEWAVGVDETVDAIRFIMKTNPTTGEPSLTEFTVMKNNDEPTLYEYANGAWSATPAFFLIEDTKPTDVFTASYTGETDPISGLADELTAGPATMNTEGIINLEFSHTLAKLKITLHKGDGFTDDLTTAKVTYKNFNYTGATGEFIINPATFATGEVIATVQVGTHTYEATAAKDINFAKGTKNTLAITLKVEEQGKRTAAMSVTTKDWAIGTDETAEAIRFDTKTDPTTGEPSLTTFTVMKNNAEPTIYEYANGTWSATPEFFLVEDTEATDVFTATATLGNPDAISGLTDELTAGPATMSTEGIINLEFSHTLAKLKITLHKGDGFTDDLTTAKVTYKNFNYTGATGEFIINPATFATGDVIASVQVGTHTYEAKAAKDINFAKGTKNTLAITLKVEEQGKRTAAMSVTTKDWTIGTDEAVEVIRFITPTDPVTGEPSLTTFTVMKNGAEPTIYEYANGTWSATPEFFLVEDTEATDMFTATATLGDADAISGLTDELTAGPATMSNEGIINLEFSHTLAKLKITLHKGDGFTDDLTTAKVTYAGISYTGDAKEFIINPATFATGEVIATVLAGGHTYEAKAAKDINFAKGTTNKLSITLKVEEQGKRTAAMSVTTKDWATGTDEAAEAIRFIAPTNPATGVPSITEFTVMKNDAEATLYSYENGTWSATPAFFTIEDTEPTDKFTATATGETDAISGLTDELVAAPAMMNNEGIINLEFSHTLAKLSIRLYAGDGFTDDALLPDAQVTYKDAQGDISYTGADETFLINPGSFDAGDVIAVVTVNSKTYEAVAAQATTFTKETANTLTIILKVEQQGKTQAGLNVTSKEWTPITGIGADGIHTIIPVAPGDGSTEVPEFTLFKNKGAAEEMSVVYKLVGTAYEPQGAVAPFYLEDVLATDEFIGQYIGSADAVTGVNDIIETPAVTPDASGVISLQFSHINAKLTLNLVKGTNFTGDLSTASVKLLSYTTTATGASNSFILAPQTIAAGTEIASITLAGLTYKAKLSSALTLTAGEHTTMGITLQPTATSITVTGVTAWGTATASTTAVALTTGNLSGMPAVAGTLTMTCNNKTGTYAWNGTTLSTTTALYWEDIQSGTSYSFKLTFTPTATTPGPVKDVLEGTASGVAYGGSPSFTLTHSNSQVNVKLVKGDYSTEEWEAITGNSTKATMVFTGLSTPAYTNSSVAYETFVSSIFAPSTANFDAETIKVTIPAKTGTPAIKENSLTILLKNHFTKLEAGKKYDITITMNKNTVSVGDIAVTDWSEITGTGDIEY